jgi:aminoglycoside phosphotransferase (APT) family kinase protein
LINCDPDTYQRVPASAGMAPPRAELVQIYQRELGREVTDLAWFCALACFKSAATWSLIVKHNRRRRAPREELEAMAATLPRLLERALSMLG